MSLLNKTPFFVAAVFAVCLSVTVASFAAEASEPPVRHTLGRAFACADYGGCHVYLVDKNGKITWEYPAQYPQDIWVLPSGNILFTHVRGVMEVTREKEIVWRYDTAEGNEIHACQPLPDGLVMVAESGPMQLVEVDREGKIRKTVKLQTKEKKTHLQMREVRKLPGGHYLVGQWGDNLLREYDGEGKIVNEIPHKEMFSGIRLPNGNTLCGTGDAHRIVEYDSNGNEVWAVNENDLPGNPLRFVAGMQRLPNGNTVVCNWGGHGHVGEQPQIFEITPDKKVVGEIYDFQRFGTISGIFILGVDADATRFEVQR